MDSLLALRDNPAAAALFRYLGVATACYWSFKALSSLYLYLQPSAVSRCVRDDRDTWAIVTGASDGIGVAFAQDLARRGFNVVLHGRNREKLEGVAKRLATDFPKVQTRLFIADASSYSTDGNLQELVDTVKGLHVTVLVNNVGGYSGKDSPFANLQDLTAEKIDSITHLNATFTTKVTRAMLPTLLQNEPSVILNIGSFACLGLPRLSVYAGTKNYLIALSEALQIELIAAGKDVTVHAAVVGAVATQRSGFATTLFSPSPEAMATATLSRAGRAPVTMAAYWGHALQGTLMGIWPQWIRQRVFIIASGDAETTWSKKQ